MGQLKPLISVLMPVYNAEKYIHDAVDSILQQTLTDFEFIIINDGSTDGSLKILETYAKQDKRIELISRENKGLVATLNEGIALANAPIIARMDADDISLPTRFGEQVSYLDNNLGVVCVGGSAIIIDEAGRELTKLQTPEDNSKIQAELLKGHASLFHAAVMFRKKVTQQVGLYRNELYPAEDLDLWLRLGEQGELANLNKTVIKYRFHSNSISGRMVREQREAARASCEEAWGRREIKGVFEATGDWRPNEDRLSKHSYLLKFGWWAFNYGNKKAATIYGVKAIKLLPFNKDSWMLLICALFKGVK